MRKTRKLQIARHVLVIDDNADIRNYVKTLLAEEYHVLDAPEAATGIRLAMKYVPM